MRKILVCAGFLFFFLGSSVCVFAGATEAAEPPEHPKLLTIGEYAISLGETKTNKDGFLEITLAVTVPGKGKSPSWLAAALTTKNGKSPLHIGRGCMDRQFINKGSEEYRLQFATKGEPENLYLKLGDWSQKEGSSKWYRFAMQTGHAEVIEGAPPFEPVTVYDRQKLKNAAKSIKNIRKFTPATPKPMHFIVYANPVINPLTKRESTGGRANTTRYLPVSTQDVVNDNGFLKKTGGLILTDNPDLATFALILDLTYQYKGGTFTYSDNTKVKQYQAVNTFELYNLITRKSITTKITTYATYVGEKVSVTTSSKGKQMFAGTVATQFRFGAQAGSGILATKFPGYVDFVSK